MSLIYIEFISRRPGVALEAFHVVAGGGQEGWAGDYDADVAVLNLGRTWRMGPEPEYLTAWYSPSAGLERLDEWERIFKSGDAARFEEPFRLAARIDRSGVYEPLLEPVVGTAGRYYAEYFDVAPGATRDDVRAAYEERAARHSALALNLLCDRIGALGPDPADWRSGALPRMRRWRRSHESWTASSARSASSPRRSTTTSARRRCELMTLPLAADGRGVIVAIDHPLYSWPCRGLEDRELLLRAVVGAGADAVIVSYGTLRDCSDALGRAAPILKLDLTTLTLGGYGTTEYVAAWTVDDALRSGAAAVLTYVQVGTPFELAALQLAGRVAAAADSAGVAYVCEIMPQGDDPLAIAACCRSAAELGARVVKTSFPGRPRRSQMQSAAASRSCSPAVTRASPPRARRRGRGHGGRRRRRRIRSQRLGRRRPGRDGAGPGPDRARRSGARPMTAPVRLGVVGTGDVALRDYLPELGRLAGRAEVVAFASRDGERALAATARFPGARAYAGYADL